MATNYVFRPEGEEYSTIETTWHNVEYFTADKNEVDALRKGAVVYVIGRIKMDKYINTNNNEMMIYAVRAYKIQVEQ